MKKMTLEELAGLDDQETLELLGFAEKADAFKKKIEEARKLKPSQKAYVEERINKMLTPNIYGDEVDWAIRDAKRKEQTGKEAMADDTPESVL